MTKYLGPNTNPYITKKPSSVNNNTIFNTSGVKPTGAIYPQKPSSGSNNTIFNTSGVKPTGATLPSKEEWQATVTKPETNPNTGSSSGSSSSGSSGGSSGSSSTALYNAYMAKLEAQREAERRRQEALQREQINSATQAKDKLFGSIADSYNFGENRLNQSLSDALSQAYIAKMQAERAMPQQMSAMGNTGGMTESAILGQNSNYQAGRMGLQENAADKLAALLAQRQQSETAAEQDYQNTVMGIKNNASNAIGGLESQYANNLASMQAAAQNAQIMAQELAAKQQADAQRAEEKRITAQQTAVTSSPGYKYAINLLNNGYTAKDIDKTLSQSGYDEATRTKLLTALGFQPQSTDSGQVKASFIASQLKRQGYPDSAIDTFLASLGL